MNRHENQKSSSGRGPGYKSGGSRFESRFWFKFFLMRSYNVNFPRYKLWVCFQLIIWFKSFSNLVSLSLSLLQWRPLKMETVHEISSETRAVIVVLYNEGKFECVTDSQLKLSKTCVHNKVTRYKETDCDQDCLRSGRPKATTSSEDKFIVVTTKRDRRLTAPQIRA